MYEVVDMSTIPDAHPVAVFDTSWRKLKGAGMAPDWDTFDAVEHPRILPWILLLRPEEDGNLRYTVCGEGTTEVYGRSMKGMVFGQHLASDLSEHFLDANERVQSTRTPLVAKTSTPIIDREFIQLFRGVFPFLAAGGALQRICVISAPVGQTC